MKARRAARRRAYVPPDAVRAARVVQLRADGLSSLGVGATLRRSSPHVMWLRGLVLLGPLVTLAATMAARGTFQPVALVVVTALASGAAASTDSHVGLLVVLVLGLHWVQTVNDPVTPWVLLAALGLTVFHTASAALTVGPPAARWTAAMARRGARRGAIAWSAAAVTWLAVVGFERLEPAGRAVWLVVALAGATALASWLRSRSLRR